MKSCLDAIVLSSQTTAKPTEKPYPGPDNGEAILPGDDNTDGNYFKTTAQACTLIGVEVADNREADLFEEIRYSSFMMVIHDNNQYLTQQTATANRNNLYVAL